MTETATAKQISYIADLEAKSGHTWTEYVNCPAGATLDRMPKAIASQVIGALLAECPQQPKARAQYRSGRSAYFAAQRRADFGSQLRTMDEWDNGDF